MDDCINPTTQRPFAKSKSAKGEVTSMRVLEKSLDPNETRLPALRDLILVSIDTEYSDAKQELYQIGLAILDTRELTRLSTEEVNDEAIEQVVTRRLFLIKRHHIPKAQRFPDFLYGFPESAKNKNLNELLTPILVPCDDFGHPRRVILVGHSLKTDTRVLQQYGGVDLPALPSIIAFIDTAPLLSRLFHNDYRVHSLKDTCRALGIPHAKLHNAGNDALYTLQALLLFFHHHKTNKEYQPFGSAEAEDRTGQEMLWKCQLDMLKRIARASYMIPRDIRRPKLKDKTLNPSVPDLLDSDQTGDSILSIFESG